MEVSTDLFVVSYFSLRFYSMTLLNEVLVAQLLFAIGRTPALEHSPFQARQILCQAVRGKGLPIKKTATENLCLIFF